jgi:hypothetical protein
MREKADRRVIVKLQPQAASHKQKEENYKLYV